ncbi:MAG: FIST N-terminal domain-containing protein [Lachnospiraceae bacterium]|nr:FIST N-terminal domain-containing protein [Lachnospiraceae bacterium]
MKQFYGMSQKGDLREAVRGLENPGLIMLMSNGDQFAEHVEELEKLYPGVPSIGCIGMSYDTGVVEKGVGIVAFTQGVTAAANVLEQVSSMPVKYIQRMEQDVQKINASSKDTVCIDFCSGNDACVLTTIYSVLGKKNISLVGGTGDAGKVSLNGKVYEDAAVYALIKNNNGKVKVYKENMYRPLADYRFIASKTDRSNYIIGELNGKSAKQVYQDILHISESDITTQTFKNPFGKISGKDVCIISIKEVVGSALSCFRQVNDSDVLTLLELKDYKKIVEETIQNIKQDFNHISGIFSVNCLFRYLLFSQNNNMQEYLQSMSVLGNHAGLIGYGEHYNNQFVNQSMTCVVFE